MYFRSITIYTETKILKQMKTGLEQKNKGYINYCPEKKHREKAEDVKGKGVRSDSRASFTTLKRTLEHKPTFCPVFLFTIPEASGPLQLSVCFPSRIWLSLVAFSLGCSPCLLFFLWVFSGVLHSVSHSVLISQFVVSWSYLSGFHVTLLWNSLPHEFFFGLVKTKSRLIL